MKRLHKFPFPVTLRLAGLSMVCLFTACLEFGAKEHFMDTTGMISSESGDLTGQFIPDPDPPTSGNNSLEFVLAESDGAPVVGADIIITPWMPSMGHGSTADPVVEELEDGTYLATDIVYTMNGEWELTIEVETDGTTDAFILIYNIE